MLLGVGGGDSAFYQSQFSFTSLVFHLSAGNHRALNGAGVGGFPVVQTFLPFIAATDSNQHQPNVKEKCQGLGHLKSIIPSGVLFCIGNAKCYYNVHITQMILPILYEFLNKMSYIWGPVSRLCKRNFFRGRGGEKSI